MRAPDVNDQSLNSGDPNTQVSLKEDILVKVSRKGKQECFSDPLK